MTAPAIAPVAAAASVAATAAAEEYSTIRVAACSRWHEKGRAILERADVAAISTSREGGTEHCRSRKHDEGGQHEIHTHHGDLSSKEHRRYFDA